MPRRLELEYGAKIRACSDVGNLEPKQLVKHAKDVWGIIVSEKVVISRQNKDWSSSGIIMDRADVETQLGDRLRHNQYADRFGDDIAAESLRAELAEGLPSVVVQSARVLREWYAKYHPEAGPEHYAPGRGSPRMVL